MHPKSLAKFRNENNPPRVDELPSTSYSETPRRSERKRDFSGFFLLFTFLIPKTFKEIRLDTECLIDVTFDLGAIFIFHGTSLLNKWT